MLCPFFPTVTLEDVLCGGCCRKRRRVQSQSWTCPLIGQTSKANIWQMTNTEIHKKNKYKNTQTHKYMDTQILIYMYRSSPPNWSDIQRTHVTDEETKGKTDKHTNRQWNSVALYLLYVRLFEFSKMEHSMELWVGHVDWWKFWMALSNRDKTKTNTCHKEDVTDDRIVGRTWPREWCTF